MNIKIIKFTAAIVAAFCSSASIAGECPDDREKIGDHTITFENFSGFGLTEEECKIDAGLNKFNPPDPNHLAIARDCREDGGLLMEEEPPSDEWVFAPLPLGFPGYYCTLASATLICCEYP